MIKEKKRSVQLLLITAVGILLALFCSIQSTGAWFTSGGQQIECTVTIGTMKLNVYQVKGSSDTLLSGTSYVDLNYDAGKSGDTLEILPDTEYGLQLKLKNEDTGASGYYIRYKIEFLLCGKSGSEPLNATITGNDTKFHYLDDNGTDNEVGWYYYGTSSAESGRETFETETEAIMMTNFMIPYSEFITNNYNANIIKINITVECSQTKTFA